MDAVRADSIRFTYRPDVTFRTLFGRAEPDVGREALRGVSLRIAPGEVYGILGPNGAGKTTLLKILSTILVPSAGRLEILGREPERHAQAVRAEVGVSLGEFERTFQLRLTGRKNLEFHAAFLGLTRADGRRRAEETLAVVGLDHAAERLFLEYSTGMKQRLALARALLGRPRFLVLDEPTAGLDPASSRALGETVRRLAADGVAVAYSTHRLEEAGRLCDRVLVLKEGVAVTEAAPADIRRLHQGTEVIAVRALRVPEAALRDLRALPSVSTVVEGGEFLRVHVDRVSTRLYEVLRVLEKHGVEVHGVRTEEPDLSDAFLRLTGGVAA